MRTIFDFPPALSRRATLAVGLASLAGACASTTAIATDASSIAEDLATYAGFGPKHAGGEGDSACGAWIETRLSTLGYRCERQAVAAIDVVDREASLLLDGNATPLAVHDHGARAEAARIEGPLLTWTPGAGALERAGGAIVFVHLPSRRWSSAVQPDIRDAIAQGFAAGARVVVLVTHGPTGELIRLNRPLENQAGPVLLLAPRVWREHDFATRIGRTATLSIDARQTERQAFNLIGRLDRGASTWIVVSTPRSGWGVCAGERGPGIAAFLALASWARQAFAHDNLAFLCTSSHEFENAGGEAFIANGAPPASQTSLWLHLGAGFAARDWHETGGRLLPMQSVDAQRFLLASEPLLDPARSCFAGAPGLETPYPANAGAQGELGNIVAAGYPRVVGLLGAHRFHHTHLDDMRCVEPAHTSDVVRRLEQLMLLARGA